VLLTVTVVGWKLQVAFLGSPVQENCSAPEYPPMGVIVIVSITEEPGVTLSAVVLGATTIVGGTGLTEKIRVALLLPNPRELLV
jgi:hypothetical protein